MPTALRRRKAIEHYQTLDTLPEPDFDDVAALAAKLCHTSFAAISFIDEKRQWFKAEWGLGIRETPIKQSFCAHAIQQDDIFLVGNTSTNAVFAANSLGSGLID